MKRRLLFTSTLFFAGFQRLYWSVFSLLFFTQMNLVVNKRLYKELLFRFFLSFLASLPAAIILHLCFSLVLLPFFYQNHRRYAEYIASLFTPLLAFLGFFLLYFSKDHGRESDRTVFFLVIWFLVFLWAVSNIVFRDRILEGRRTDEGFHFGGLVKKLIGYYKDGVACFIKDVFLKPPMVASSRRRRIFQPVLYPLLVAHFFLIIKFGVFMTENLIQFLLMCALDLLSLVILVNFVYFVARKSKLILGFFIALLSILYFLLFFFHFNQSSPLDPSLIFMNSTIMFNKSAFVVYKSKINPLIFFSSLCFLGWTAYLIVRFKLYATQLQKNHTIIYPLGFLLWWFFVLFTKIPVTEELAVVSRSTKAFLEEKESRNRLKIVLKEPYPYLQKEADQFFQSGHEKKPDIFIVLLESFNQLLVERHSEHGKEITPVFNELIKEGLYIDTFYGNSIQTSRGLVAIFSGIYPSFRNKVFTSHSHMNYKAFPEILKDNGYGTVFFNAHYDKNFDRKIDNLTRMGFEWFIPMAGDLIEDIPRDKFWNWGIQDDEFYKQCFAYLD